MPDSSPALVPSNTSPLPCACTALRRSGRALSRLYDEALAETGLRVTQYALLAALARTGLVSLTALADELVMDRTTLSRNLMPLERAGLVVLEPGRDRRTRCTRLTDEGTRRLAAARPAWLAAQERVTERFGRERLGALVAELTAIVGVAQEPVADRYQASGVSNDVFAKASATSEGRPLPDPSTSSG